MELEGDLLKGGRSNTAGGDVNVHGFLNAWLRRIFLIR